MSLRVLHAGIDTLEVSFSGEVREEVATALDVEKTAAVESPRSYYVGGMIEMMVQGRAYGWWRWRLVSPEFSVVMRNGNARAGVTAQVRFSAFGLAHQELGELWSRAKLALGFLGEFNPTSVARCDVYADFQGWTPTGQDLAALVCAAPYRATHGTQSGVQTFQYGKGDVVVRVYDKTAELAVSGKAWFVDLWGQSQDFEPGQPVWRVEAQLRRKALGGLDVDCVEQVMDKPGALLDFGLRWAQLRVPSADATSTRWPEDPRWTSLREAVFGGVPLGRVPRTAQLMDLERVKTHLVGLVATAGAYFECSDFINTLVRLTYATEAHMMREKIDFAALVENKRRRILSGSD